MCSNTQPAFQSALLVSEVSAPLWRLIRILVPPPGWPCFSHRSVSVQLCSHIPLILLFTLAGSSLFWLGEGGVGRGAGHTALVTWALDILCGPESGTVLHVEGCQANELWLIFLFKVLCFLVTPLPPWLVSTWLCLDLSPFYWVCGIL